jgi:hypothetical protein
MALQSCILYQIKVYLFGIQRGLFMSRLKKARSGKKKVRLGYTRHARPRVPSSRDNESWPEEEQAISDIRSGKVKTEDVTGEDFLKEIRSVINERTGKTA